MSDEEKARDGKAFTKRGAEEAAKKRAENLAPERRSEIARTAAHARWNVAKNEEVLREEFPGNIVLGEHTLPCAVLSNKLRVLSERGLAKALGSSRGGSHWRRMREMGEGEYLPVFLSATNLAPYISPSLRMLLSRPVKYKAKRGGDPYGIPATVIPEICEVFLRARRDKGVLTKEQEQFAATAEVIVGGLAKVGIIALVDEATGYQEVRNRQNRLTYHMWGCRIPNGLICCEAGPALTGPASIDGTGYRRDGWDFIGFPQPLKSFDNLQWRLENTKRSCNLSRTLFDPPRLAAGRGARPRDPSAWREEVLD